MICHKPWGVYKIIEIQTYMCQSTSTQFGIVRNAEIGRLTACWWQAVRGDVGIFCSKYQETSLQLGYRCKPVGFIVFIFDCFILIIIITVIMENATHTHTHIYKSCSELCLNMWIFQVTARCPAVCECPTEPPVCPPGVSAVSDRCGCCKVCAAQLNQDCSPARPCDHHKGLECNYGNDVTMAWGICRGEKTMNAGREEISEEGGGKATSEVLKYKKM